MPSSPHWKLRRLADRVLRVHARRSAESPALAIYANTLVPKTQSFMAAYDASRNAEANWRKEMTEGRGAVAALVKAMRSWLPAFTRDVPGFDASDFADRADVPDDVLGDATRLLDGATPAEGPAPSWAPAFEAALGPALAAAVEQWTQAESADASYQKLLRTVREAAASFDAELQLYRLALAAVVGTKDKDYQKLRAQKAAAQDDEDATPLAGGDAAGAPVEPGQPPT